MDRHDHDTISTSYLHWMGIAAWTGGPAIPRRSRGLSIAPGDTPGHVSIESAGGCAAPLALIEREHTHIQWLLGGAPREETALEYTHRQDLSITDGTLTEPAFTIVDFRDMPGDGGGHCPGDRPSGPEATLAAARRVCPMLREHIPAWKLAEPLGLIALAVREYLTGPVIHRLTVEHVRRRRDEARRPGSAVAFGRLAYSVSSATSAMTLHVAEGDPIFTPAVLEHLVDRAQVFADVFGSTVDCRATFGRIITHGVFPSTIHEPDAEDTPIILYRVPLPAEALPVGPLPPLMPSAAGAPDHEPDCAPDPGHATLPLPAPGTVDVDRRRTVILRRDPDSGIIEIRPFTPGRTPVDRTIRNGGYLVPAEALDDLGRECAADAGCLAAHATPATVWESLSTWGLAPHTIAGVAGSTPIHPATGGEPRVAVHGPGSVRALRPTVASPCGRSVNRPLLSVEVDAAAPADAVLHNVCDVLDALGVVPPTDYPIEITWSSGDAPASHTTEGAPDDDGAPVDAGNPPADSTASGTPGSPVLPSLWPRALGARRLAVSDRAMALAVVRHAVYGRDLRAASWIGVRHAGPSSSRGRHRITVAVLRDGGNPAGADALPGLADAIGDACAACLPGANVTCGIVDASGLADVRRWVTVAGRHPLSGFLPPAMQLERLADSTP